MQRPEHIAAHHGGFRLAGRALGAVAIEHHEGIKLGLDDVQAGQQVVDNVDGRHFSRAHELDERMGRERLQATARHGRHRADRSHASTSRNVLWYVAPAPMSVSRSEQRMFTVPDTASASGRWPGTRTTPSLTSSLTLRTRPMCPRPLNKRTLVSPARPRRSASLGWSTQDGSPSRWRRNAFAENAV